MSRRPRAGSSLDAGHRQPPLPPRGGHGFRTCLGRHCANAHRLDWGHVRAAGWLGDKTVDMTRREYEHNPRLHERLHGRDWLQRIARRSDRAAKDAVPLRAKG